MRLISIFGFALCALGAPAQVWEKLIEPGLAYRMEIDAQTPRVIHALRLFPGNSGVRATAELAGGKVFAATEDQGRATLSDIVRESGAIAAVNGDFFPFTGDPLGGMVRSGELVSMPDPRRAAIGWGGGGEAVVSLLQWRGQVVLPGGETLTLAGLNQECPENAFVLNTSSAGLARAKSPNVHILLKVPEGTRWAPTGEVEVGVDLISADVDALPIEAGNAVLSARGDAARRAVDLLKPGASAKVVFQTTGMDWNRVEHVMGGGPVLVRGGRPAIDWESAGFRSNFATDRHPRTAIGVGASGDVWFVVVDGRQSMSAGATLEELAAIMIRLGCREAANLDGGGSSTMNLFGLTMNRPSDGQERKISNGVVFRSKLPASTEGDIAIRGPRSLRTGDSTSYVLIGADGKPVAHAQVLWSASGSAWIDQGGVVRALRPGAATIFAWTSGKVARLPVTVEEPPTGQPVSAILRASRTVDQAPRTHRLPTSPQAPSRRPAGSRSRT
jgi:hypothetical protein